MFVCVCVCVCILICVETVYVFIEWLSIIITVCIFRFNDKLFNEFETKIRDESPFVVFCCLKYTRLKKKDVQYVLMKVASCSFGSHITYISFLAEQDNFRCDNKCTRIVFYVDIKRKMM